MHGRRRRRAAAAALAAALVAGGTLAGCSGDDDETSPGPSGKSAAEGESTGASTDAELGAVRGALEDDRAAKVLADVTAVVDAWFDRAYAVGPADDAALADFTPDARELALAQPAIMSNAEVADADAVEVTERLVRVDVLAPRGRVSGATVRFRLAFDLAGGTERSDRVAGRLMLVPGKDGWKVFGFDVRREGGA